MVDALKKSRLTHGKVLLCVGKSGDNHAEFIMADCATVTNFQNKLAGMRRANASLAESFRSLLDANGFRFLIFMCSTVRR